MPPSAVPKQVVVDAHGNESGEGLTAAFVPALAVRHEPVTGRPCTVELEFDAEHLASAATVVPGVEQSGERRVSYTSGTMYEGIRTFKAVTTIVSSAVEEQYG